MSIEPARSGHARRALDFTGFAQEFLRRNPDHAADYERLHRDRPAQGSTIEKETMAQRWGLSFSVRT